ncbi:hypothetical protein SAY87_008255 [Trapa incisa]|uniref:Uncharacterized protein n=1 Tax=Trapa incisa TaxID=236973 RepID=A0AAN7KL08_9MYRT|nr:hypothetical protein SAY87_008255 [Trapa incisa]
MCSCFCHPTSASLPSLFLFLLLLFLIVLLPMEEDDQKEELQLLPTPHPINAAADTSSSNSSGHLSMKLYRPDHYSYEAAPSALDLQLSISLRPIHHGRPADQEECHISGAPLICDHDQYSPETASVKALKWHAAEQIRLATIEKAYAERVRELTRREMELAQSEFSRARNMWERAREEVDKAEKMKERAIRRIDSTCMEITCQSCRQRFRPA